VTQVLRQHFRPEFLNRIDETIIFHSLTQEQIRDIVGIQLAALAGRLRDRRISIELTDDAKGLLAERGWDQVYGARPLKRAIQRSILDPLALDVLQGKFQEGDTILIRRDGSNLVFDTDRSAVRDEEPVSV
jgi:ATP-dependent Clp protease ATP-binding subunit ClpB